MSTPAVVDSGACISEDGVYRYVLWRIWDASLPRVAFIGLNPSTADATENDATISKCVRYALSWKCGGIVMLNLFALRSRDPKALYAPGVEPVGALNQAHVLAQVKHCALVVACWSKEKIAELAGQRMRDLLTGRGVNLHVLRLTRSGAPGHPLYLPGDLKPVSWSSYVTSTPLVGAYGSLAGASCCQECPECVLQSGMWPLCARCLHRRYLCLKDHQGKDVRLHCAPGCSLCEALGCFAVDFAAELAEQKSEYENYRESEAAKDGTQSGSV